VAEWWGPQDDPEAVREGLEGAESYVIAVDGETAGWLQVYEENDPDYRYGGIDLFLAERFQGHGLGPRAVQAAVEMLVARGHHRITIDPAVDNERAIRAYEKAGFKPVGVMHRCERGADGSWHDNLLMELVLSPS